MLDPGNPFRNPHPLIGKIAALTIITSSGDLKEHPGTLLSLEQNEDLSLAAMVLDEEDGRIKRFKLGAFTFPAFEVDGKLIPDQKRFFSYWESYVAYERGLMRLGVLIWKPYRTSE